MKTTLSKETKRGEPKWCSAHLIPFWKQHRYSTYALR